MSQLPRSTPPAPADTPILFVDDEPANLETIRYLLDEEFEVVTASTGEEAIALMQERHFAVLVCDQRMPGMSGVEVCARARVIAPHTVRILLTAYSDVDVVVDAINEGAVSRYIKKPLNTEGIRRALRESVTTYRSAHQVREAGSTLLHEGLALAAETAEAEIAHDINNMLAPVVLLLQRAQAGLAEARSCSVDSKLSLVSTDLDQAAGALVVLQSFVQRLRGGSTEVGAAESELGRVVDATVHMFEPRLKPCADLTLVVETESVIRLDAASLTQVFVNLLVNALDAIETRPGRGEIEVVIDQHDEQARLIVRDNGGGIDPESLPHIFEGRFTTKANGTGRGLSIARRITRKAQGSISATNTEDGRAQFTVLLPISLEE